MNENISREVPKSDKNERVYMKLCQGIFEGTLYRNINSHYQPSYNLVNGNTVWNITGTAARQLEEITDKVTGHRVEIVVERRTSPKYNREYFYITHIENLGNGSRKQIELVGFE